MTFVNKLPMLALALSGTLGGCNAYFVSKQSLMEQFANSKTVPAEIKSFVPPFNFYPGTANGDNLKTITCITQKGKKNIINVTNHTKAILVSNKEGAQLHKFYFNSIVLQDSVISGSNSNDAHAAIQKTNLIYVSHIQIKKR